MRQLPLKTLVAGDDRFPTWNLRWVGTSAPCWMFWNANSGSVGGALAALVFVALPLVALFIWTWSRA